jgi:hypothetical protein
VNVERIITPPVLALIGVAALTTIFARKNSASVLNAIGSSFSNAIRAALGQGAVSTGGATVITPIS